MNKILSVALLSAVVLMSGCKPREVVATSEGKQVTQYGSYGGSASPICYQNIQYVKFSYGESAWGGAQFDQQGKLVHCDGTTERGSIEEVCYKGSVYIRFSYGESAWGGAKYGNDGNVVTCGNGVTTDSTAKTIESPHNVK